MNIGASLIKCLPLVWKASIGLFPRTYVRGGRGLGKGGDPLTSVRLSDSDLIFRGHSSSVRALVHASVTSSYECATIRPSLLGLSLKGRESIKVSCDTNRFPSRGAVPGRVARKASVYVQTELARTNRHVNMATAQAVSQGISAKEGMKVVRNMMRVQACPRLGYQSPPLVCCAACTADAGSTTSAAANETSM